MNSVETSEGSFLWSPTLPVGKNELSQQPQPSLVILCIILITVSTMLITIKLISIFTSTPTSLSSRLSAISKLISELRKNWAVSSLRQPLLRLSSLLFSICDFKHIKADLLTINQFDNFYCDKGLSTPSSSSSLSSSLSFKERLPHQRVSFSKSVDHHTCYQHCGHHCHPYLHRLSTVSSTTSTGSGSVFIFSLDLLWCAFLLLLAGLLFVPVGIRAAIRPSCKCIVFDDTYSKEYGIFTSPDWPTPYDDNTDCLLYTFQAPSDAIVEINFDEFDVQKNEEVG